MYGETDVMRIFIYLFKIISQGSRVSYRTGNVYETIPKTSLFDNFCFNLSKVRRLVKQKG
jgi:hypothetical protein